MKFPQPIIFTAGLTLCFTAGAQVTNAAIATADAFLCTGSASNPRGADLTAFNYGAAGLVAIASASSAKGEFQGLLKFNLSSSGAAFNSAYGSNRWSITGISLQLACNVAVADVQPNDPTFDVISGGHFVIEWLANDDWQEGTGLTTNPTTDGVCYNSLPTLLAQPREALCTNNYVPPGNNVPVVWPLPLSMSLVTDICGGGDVTFRFYAADNRVGYLFNSYKYGRGNEPTIVVVATPALTILSGAFTNGFFQLTGLGNNNATYQIQISTNLATKNWLTIGTAAADDRGNILFDDFGATNAQRFYRFSQ